MKRPVRAATVALLVGLLAAVGAVAPAMAAGRVPRVVLVVGPVGSLTSEYRRLANAAADEAIAAGADVIKVYSPNATWSAVRRALQGASIVVYLGHGNGWPSPYRDELYPPTQNGFGLNPVAGVDDSAHQYFGEASVAKLHLAPNAVVLLHHLCYASGNSEPGLAEGTQAMSIQRVDNYAAGFIRAGAKAVVAEAHLGPAYYVRALLRSRLSIEQIWRQSPDNHGNTFSVASARSPGFAERLDPDRASGGFYRSLVSRGVTAAVVRSGATGVVTTTATRTGARPPVDPTLVGLGLTFRAPRLAALPIAGATDHLALPIPAKGVRLIPVGARVGVRWDPILLDPPPGLVPAPAGSLPTSSPPAPAAPDVDLVVPEQLGSVVTVARADRTEKGLRVAVTYPSAPGLYRLVPSLHDPMGVAYDAATQGLMTPLIVRVGGPFTAVFGAPATLFVTAAAAASLPVRVVNAGTASWDVASATPPVDPDALLLWLRTSRAPARVTATWVSSEGRAVPGPVAAALDPDATAPGGDTTVELELVAPAEPGAYLVLLDVVSTSHGALSSLGNAPALIRVSVAPGPINVSVPNDTRRTSP